MEAAILAVGSELLRGDRIDTNSVRLAGVLRRAGARPISQTIVGDDEERLALEIRRLAAAADVVVVGGGLGPTVDDRTRPACARALGRNLERDPALVSALRERAASRGRRLADVAEQQAEVVEGATVLRNPEGSAPGQRIDLDGGAAVFLLPGVPSELDAMAALHLEPWLEERIGPFTPPREVVFRVADRGESDLEGLLRPLWDEWGREGVGLFASPGEVEIHLEGVDPGLVDAVRDALGRRAFAEGPIPLAAVVGGLLEERGETLVTAESCTGGMVGAELTSIAGSSAWFGGGAVTYSNELKQGLLGVGDADLLRCGAVSVEVALAMARGARERLGGDWAISITGVAGPEGGTEEKPVGTVHLGWAGPRGDGTSSRRFPGDRDGVRRRTVKAALELLRRKLTEDV